MQPNEMGHTFLISHWEHQNGWIINGGIVLFVDSLRFVRTHTEARHSFFGLRLRCMMYGVLTVPSNVCLTTVCICRTAGGSGGNGDGDD